MQFGQLDSPPPPGHTIIGAYVKLLLGTAQGTYYSLDKSVIQPTQEIIFLGYLFNTVDQTIAVPLEKYYDTMTLLREFIKRCEETQQIHIKTLQRIRVSFIERILMEHIYFCLLKLERFLMKHIHELYRKKEF